MFNTAAVVSPAFSMAQHATLREWSDRRPRGFRICIATDEECAEEVAYAYQRDECPYDLRPTLTGRIYLGTADGNGWEVNTLEGALALLLVNEEVLEAEWIAAGM